MIILLRIYQILIMIPLMVVLTILTSLIVGGGSICFGGRWWGYYPAVVWARLMTWLSLVSVSARGRKDVSRGTWCVSGAMQQGS